MRTSTPKILLLAFATGAATELVLFFISTFGEWREGFPASLSAAVWFFPHLPALLLCDALGMPYLSDLSVAVSSIVTAFAMSMVWFAFFSFFFVRRKVRHDAA
jgi:hypothetical protein